MSRVILLKNGMALNSTRPQIRITKTRTIPRPNEYVQALSGEFADWTFDEEEVCDCKGRWRKDIFKVDDQAKVTLEIGTGNGFHFAHYAEQNPQISLIGIELKYKPLIQAIRRSRASGCENSRMARYNARLIDDLFCEGELNDVIVHFPDPYLKTRLRKRRLLTTEFLNRLYQLQRPGSKIEFKTDSEDYFDWVCQQVPGSNYEVTFQSRDLHHSEKAETNFMTAFEKIFTSQGLPIYAMDLLRK